MRFCNESANIGTFWELTTNDFKNIPSVLTPLGMDSVCSHSRSNILSLNGIFQ
jgi:hypothetical protein